MLQGRVVLFTSFNEYPFWFLKGKKEVVTKGTRGTGPHPRGAGGHSQEPSFLTLNKVSMFFLLLMVTVLAVKLMVLFSTDCACTFCGGGKSDACFFGHRLVFTIINIIYVLLVSGLECSCLGVLTIPNLVIS